jgi:hypothetical protein
VPELLTRPAIRQIRYHDSTRYVYTQLSLGHQYPPVHRIIMFTDSNHTGEGGVKGGKLDGYPDFGRAMLKEFQFEDGCKSPIWLY